MKTETGGRKRKPEPAAAAAAGAIGNSTGDAGGSGGDFATLDVLVDGTPLPLPALPFCRTPALPLPVGISPGVSGCRQIDRTGAWVVLGAPLPVRCSADGADRYVVTSFAAQSTYVRLQRPAPGRLATLPY